VTSRDQRVPFANEVHPLEKLLPSSKALLLLSLSLASLSLSLSLPLSPFPLPLLLPVVGPKWLEAVGSRNGLDEGVELTARANFIGIVKD
jgi:hypothetical protein